MHTDNARKHTILQATLFLLQWGMIHPFVNHPRPALTLANVPLPRLISNKTSSPSALLGMFDRDQDLVGKDRLKACIPYLLPLIDGDQFGVFIYDRIPVLGMFDYVTIRPLSDLAFNVPFLTATLFVALTIGTRFNWDMDRNIRFSAQQAALIDIALLAPQLIASSLQGESLPRTLVEPACNFVWFTYMTAVVYSVYSNLRGKRPDKIPFISAYADQLVGPI